MAMATQVRESARTLRVRGLNIALVTAILLALTVIAAQVGHAQTFQVIYSFTGGVDGAAPLAGVTMDGAGNLYGTTANGGEYQGGAVYELKHTGSRWVVKPLYSFQFVNSPEARVIFGPNGSLYGTTVRGGDGRCPGDEGCGTVFNLRPQPTFCPAVLCPWTITELYQFQGGLDGAAPLGDLLFDESGNIYGTTSGSTNLMSNGTVYELSPSGNSWTESVLYSFTEYNAFPMAGVIPDGAGNLYGTVSGEGNTAGAVYELTPSNGSWTPSVLYEFTGGNDGFFPFGGVIFDQSGNLYGSTSSGGSGNGGTVFELSPSNGRWTYALLYTFTGSSDYCGPSTSLAMDAAGNLYGTTTCDGTNGFGSIFELTPRPTPPWTYTSLHDFTGGSDGGYPYSNVTMVGGNLYGTAPVGGPAGGCGGPGCGIVWEITP
jgi:uncharacterized repeat protein (TIGR03803 family)